MGMMLGDDDRIRRELAAQVARQRGHRPLPTTIPAALFFALVAFAIFLFWRF
jgi:hypothetical protein